VLYSVRGHKSCEVKKTCCIKFAYADIDLALLMEVHIEVRSVFDD
jgi:hypothetical protein